MAAMASAAMLADITTRGFMAARTAATAWDTTAAATTRAPTTLGLEEGSVRIKVKPRNGSVYVDGYFAGEVDDFDGVFQRLHVEPGAHRIEVRADGYAALSFEVRVPPGRTVNYSGELRKLP